MRRNNKLVYLFITDENHMYYRAIQQTDGSYSITKNSQPYPIYHLPTNIKASPAEFATNSKYFSLNRSISYPLDFIKDGAAILRNFYHLGKGTEAQAYITIIEFNGKTGKYEQSYKGKVDFSQRHEDPKSGIFNVPTVDDSAWGLLSQNDDVVFATECNATNPKAIRVVVDGITLVNRYTFQAVEAPISAIGQDTFHMIPIALVNQDGDSAGVTSQSQQGASFGSTLPGRVINGVVIPPEAFVGYFESAYALNGVSISGNYKFTWSTNGAQSGGVYIYFCTSTGQRFIVADMNTPGALTAGQFYSYDFEFTLNLQAGEKCYYLMYLADTSSNNFTIHPVISNIVIRTNTKAQPTAVWALRPLDLLQSIVSQATKGRHTINSEFLTVNNKAVFTSGDALRGLQNAKVYISFEDAFKSIDARDFVALRTIKDKLWIEEAVVVYDDADTLIDLGEAIDVTFTPANEYLANEIMVGSPKHDLRHPSGRLEFNSTNTFSINMQNSKRKLDLVSKVGLGCYEIQFLILDYVNGSTKDNNGDKSCFCLDITDTVITSREDVETFENVNILDAPLEPIITSPLDNDIVHSIRPTIKGIANANANINIYVDGVLDGSTTSDSAGKWSYNIANDISPFVVDSTDGVHIIDASFLDLDAPTTTINITIRTDVVTAQIVYPSEGESLYNNAPLLKGTSMPNVNILVNIDGIDWATVVADGSGRWEYQSPVLSSSAHVFTINGGEDVSHITVNSNVSSPLITFIDRPIDQFPVLNNLPLIKGVSLPLAVVRIWLNYVSYVPLGTTSADINGNWNFQVVPVTYLDPYSNTQVPLAPIRNGLNIISTSLENKTVSTSVSGYSLNRPAYQNISGVPDNSVFNTRFSPMRMLLKSGPRVAPILMKQPQERVRFRTEDKNASLVTNLNGVIISERSDVTLSQLGAPLFSPEWANITVKTDRTFIQTLEDFNKGGLVKVTFRGNELKMLPIGSMKMTSIVDDVQTWKLLMSPQTPFSTLLNLYKNGSTIKLMNNSIYHSDYNTLHIVSYDFQKNPKYNFREIYDDWFSQRNDAWNHSGGYIQKWQRGETIVDQIVSNGTANLALAIYRCRDGRFMYNYMYEAVTQAPIPPPDTVLETRINMLGFPEDRYFFVLNIADTSLSSTIDVFHPFIIVNINEYSFYVRGDARLSDRVRIAVYKYTGVVDPTQAGIFEGRVFTLELLEGESPTSIRDRLYDLIVPEIDYLVLTAVDKVTYSDGSPGITLRRFGIQPVFALINVTHVMSVGTPLGISEPIDSRDVWSNTILLEASNSINQTDCFFSTGFKSVFRVEGLVKKWQPDVSTVVSKNDLGMNNLLYGNTTRKRIIRYGDAYGLPDYLYLKIAAAIVLDDVKVENVGYTIAPDEKIAPSEDVSGHPLYYYDVVMDTKYNERGFTFHSDDSVDTNSVLINVDGPALGMPVGSLINIVINPE